MKIKLDKKADALYIRFKPGKVHKTVAIDGNYMIDLCNKGEVMGIEVLNYSKITKATPERFSVSVVGVGGKLLLPV